MAKEQAQKPVPFPVNHASPKESTRHQEGCSAPASAAAHQLLRASNHAQPALIHLIQRAQDRARTTVDHLVVPSFTATSTLGRHSTLGQNFRRLSSLMHGQPPTCPLPPVLRCGRLALFPPPVPPMTNSAHSPTAAGRLEGTIHPRPPPLQEVP